MALGGRRKRGWTRPAGAKNSPSRAIAKYTRGPAITIALTLAAMLTMVERRDQVAGAEAEQTRPRSRR